ncbi:MAG: ribose-phosphate pyrophosphokinase [Lentisphaerae bacterium]|nr:ribose-phosphate pyrophosphokinase [Lentisphaerota bacterium]
MKIFTGSANRPLAEGIAERLEIPLGDIQITRFPDGEIAVKIVENIRGEDVFIIQPTCAPTNENLMELLIVIDAMRRASAARITAVMPFYGYGRQDRKDQPRVPITAKLVANLLVAAGVSRVLAMDFHAQQIQGFFDIPVDHLFASPVIVRHLREQKLGDLVVVSPDPGGMKMAYAYSRMLNAGLAIVAKQRKSPREVESYQVVGDVQGKTALIVDDLITTGGTLCGAARLLKQHGVGDIHAAITHAVFVQEAFDRLSKAPIKEIVVTDSIPLHNPDRLPITVLSVAELLAEAIQRIHSNQSVSSLFRI